MGQARVTSTAGDSPGRTAGIACLLATAVGWGLNWPIMKAIIAVWPPLFSRGVAGLVAALILAAVAKARGESLRVPPRARPKLLFAAFTNVFAWMGFTNLALKWLTAGEGALLVYTMPMWATLLAWPLAGTRPTRRGVVSLLLGLAGTATLMSGGGLALDSDKALGVALALAAAIFFALGTVLNRTPLPLGPVTGTFWQVALGCLPMAVIGIVFERPALGTVTPSLLAGMAYMTVVAMAVCYLTWFAALRRLPPATASTGMLLTPLIGVLSAAWFLGEPLGLREVVALVLTLGGVTLALRKG